MICQRSSTSREYPRRANFVPESILWRSVTLDAKDLWAWRSLARGWTCPIEMLQREERQQRDPSWFLDVDATKQPPLHPRAGLVRHVALRKREAFLDGRCYEIGIPECIVFSTFRTPSVIFNKLKSIRIDGDVTQTIWDTLLELPALQELRL